MLWFVASTPELSQQLMRLLRGHAFECSLTAGNRIAVSSTFTGDAYDLVVEQVYDPVFGRWCILACDDKRDPNVAATDFQRHCFYRRVPGRGEWVCALRNEYGRIWASPDGSSLTDMSAEDLQYDALYQLTTHAEHLNALDTPHPHAAPYYEILSGALIWPDETNASTPLPVIWALRQLWNYRTRLMLDDTEPENAVWHQCVARFPKWIGFLPERRKPSPALLAEYRRGDVSLKWCLRNAVD